MMFRKSREQVDKSVGKMDKIVTGIILGAAVASIFWLSRTRKWREMSHSIFEQSKTWAKKSIGIFGKMLAFFVSVFSKRK
jgi:hypothetical protein